MRTNEKSLGDILRESINNLNNKGKSRMYPNELLDESMDDYDVYNNDTGEFLGSIELPENASAHDMPDSLEINGIEYIAKK
jgi:hypothetical protein